MTKTIPSETGSLPARAVVFSAAEPKAARAVSYNSGTGIISYEDMSSGLAAAGVSSCIWARSDPWSYGRMFLLTDIGLLVCQDVSVTTPTWTLVANNATIFGNSNRRGYTLLMSHLRRGWMMALSGNSGAGISFDLGQTWTQVALDGSGSPSWGTSVTRGGDAAICGHDANHIYSIVQHPSNVWEHRLYKSTDGGLTWSLINATEPDNGGGGTSPMCLAIPYKRAGGANNTDDLSLSLYAVSMSTGPQAKLSRSTNQGASFSGLVYASGENRPTDSITGSSIMQFTHDASYQWFVKRLDTYNNSGIYRTTNDYASAPAYTGAGLGGNTRHNTCLNGWPMNPDVAIAFSRSQQVKMTLDGGSTWFGNLPSGWANGIAYAEFSLLFGSTSISPSSEGSPDCGIGCYASQAGETGGNPIALLDGEKREQVTDLSVLTPGGALEFTRAYRQSKLTDPNLRSLGLG